MRSICVFCGSRMGASPAFATAAAAMGRAIAGRGLELVYGGAKVGLMGVMADAALAHGGRVVGIIPRALVDKEVAHDGLAELIVTGSMHERKDRMIQQADAFVALPGGFGTYDELFEVITLAQIGFHAKPSALLDVDGYYAPFVALLRHTIEASFAQPEHAGLVVVDDDADRLVDKLLAWTMPALPNKWSAP
ncbi:MAG: Lysine decarboxylase family [Labilithrix sp.]|nr:Lysine decarboxylase family [Labilithrix sp.]